MIRTILVLAALFVALSGPARADDWAECQAREDMEAAVAACTRMLESYETPMGLRALAYWQRAAIRFRQKDFDKVISDCNEALSINPNFAPAYDTRGGAHLGRGEFDLAIADQTRAINLQPMSGYFNNRAWAYFLMGDIPKAHSDISAAERMGPLGPAELDTRGHVRAARGEKDGAVQDFLDAAQASEEMRQEYQNGLKRQRVYDGPPDGKWTKQLEDAIGACVRQFPKCDPIENADRKPVS